MAYSKVPVLIMAFNRPTHVKKAMQAIREYQPERLYLACDGPRADKEGERQLVADTRKTMEDSVDWPCELKTLFRENNLGCAQAVYGAISWFFENEDYGVIIEDDVIVGQDFFRLCEYLLPRYANEGRVMEISAQNHSFRHDIDNTYEYSQCFQMWGWASWRRAWKKMDIKMAQRKYLSIVYLIKRLGVFRGCMMQYYFMLIKRNIDAASTWDTQWYWSILVNDGLVIVPGVNLAINIGMDGGSHYEMGDKNPYADLKIGKIEWPLVYNDSLEIDSVQKRYDSQDFFNVRMIGLKKKLKRLFQ